MAEPLYQLEKAEGGAAFVCLGGRRLAEIPAAKAAAACAAVERVEGQRGQQLAMRFLAIGIALAAPSPFRASGAPSLSPEGRGEEGARA